MYEGSVAQAGGVGHPPTPSHTHRRGNRPHALGRTLGAQINYNLELSSRVIRQAEHLAGRGDLKFASICEIEVASRFTHVVCLYRRQATGSAHCASASMKIRGSEVSAKVNKVIKNRIDDGRGHRLFLGSAQDHPPAVREALHWLEADHRFSSTLHSAFHFWCNLCEASGEMGGEERRAEPPSPFGSPPARAGRGRGRGRRPALWHPASRAVPCRRARW